MFLLLTGGVKVALDVGWQIGRDEVNNDVQGVDLANGQQHVVTVKRSDKGRFMKVMVSFEINILYFIIKYTKYLLFLWEMNNVWFSLEV